MEPECATREAPAGQDRAGRVARPPAIERSEERAWVGERPAGVRRGRARLLRYGVPPLRARRRRSESGSEFSVGMLRGDCYRWETRPGSPRYIRSFRRFRLPRYPIRLFRPIGRSPDPIDLSAYSRSIYRSDQIRPPTHTPDIAGRPSDRSDFPIFPDIIRPMAPIRFRYYCRSVRRLIPDIAPIPDPIPSDLGRPPIYDPIGIRRYPITPISGYIATSCQPGPIYIRSAGFPIYFCDKRVSRRPASRSCDRMRNAAPAGQARANAKLTPERPAASKLRLPTGQKTGQLGRTLRRAAESSPLGARHSWGWGRALALPSPPWPRGPPSPPAPRVCFWLRHAPQRGCRFVLVRWVAGGCLKQAREARFQLWVTWFPLDFPGAPFRALQIRAGRLGERGAEDAAWVWVYSWTAP
jgi:hypothetical protein